VLRKYQNQCAILLFKLQQCIGLAVLLMALIVANVRAADFVSFVESKGDFPLVKDGHAAAIYVDQAEPQGLKLAVVNLQSDIQKVSNAISPLVAALANEQPLIIVGTLQSSGLIKQLVAAGKIDVSSIKGQWEAFHIQTVSKPFANVEQALVIAGSDMRGAIFGVYDLSEKIGVSPWYWWADVPVKTATSLFVKSATLFQDKPKVRYRGIFLNDEAPALTGWVQEKFGEYNSDFYQHVFELLLRLKANFLWPAMWNNAFSLDDPNNPQLANTMGIVMSTSHHEPMMRADKEWHAERDGKWDYSVNSDKLYQFWQAGAERHKSLESIFTLGMRGQADEPMGESENIALLEKIVADQRQILSNTFGKDKLTQVPQVWALYKEVQSYYENGMRVPDDVTLLWSDDNWGNLRRLPTPEERKRSGGAGVYYHFDYVGGPRSYRWINTIPIAKIWEQMHLAYEYQADRIWITNVGDLKPMEYPTDFFLRMAWDPERWTANTLVDYGQKWAAQQFGQEYAVQIEKIMTGYTRHNGRRKPELMSPDTYSLLNYNEADRISKELQSYVSEAESLYNKLPEKHKDAFFQLVLHPVKASAIIFELNYSVALNHLYAKQGRASTNDFAERAKAWFVADEQLQQQYHQLGKGKWNHFMGQAHIGYTHWNNPPANVMPAVMINEPIDEADMGVAVEGLVNAWPAIDNLALNFALYGQQQRYIDVFNKGLKAFNLSLETSASWIKLDNVPSQISGSQRVWLSIDWAKINTEHVSGTIHIKGTGWGGAKIAITAHKPHLKNVHGFVEGDGYLSIEAAKGIPLQQTDDANWQEIQNHGRTYSSMTGMVNPELNFLDRIKQAPYLEYNVYLFSTGPIQINSYLAPSLNFDPTRGIRFAIGIDDEIPQIIDVLAENTTATWEESVKNGVRIVSSKHMILSPGNKKLRLYLLESGVSLQKIVIDTGGLRPSYLGPEQSQLIP
jgi:hypothetical protein